MSRSISILRQFIYRGGLIGSIAKLYVEDEKKADGFVLELVHQLKTNRERMLNEWGTELISDLERFSQN